MKAVILAAGQGKRISSEFSLPKPLVSLFSLSLIERVILSAKKAGVKDFVVVLGWMGEKIKSKLGDGKKYGVKIEYVFNKEFKEKENGYSLFLAKDFFKKEEKFLVLMSDHIFDWRVIKELLEKKDSLKENEAYLVVDFHPPEYIDKDDATKIKLDKEGKIKNLSKKLEDYDGFDCGIFLFSTFIFDCLKEAISQGKTSLSEGVSLFTKKGKLFPFSQKYFWQDVDTKKDLEFAKKILLKNAFERKEDGPITKILNRKISSFLTPFLVYFSPNFISFLSFLLGAISGFLFAMGGRIFNLFGAILVQLSSIIDGCDGEVARLKFQESQVGAVFDSVLDRYADAMIILGIGTQLLKENFSLSVFFLIFLALLGSIMPAYLGGYSRYHLGAKKIPKSLPTERDIRLFLIFLGGILNNFWWVLFLLSLFNLEVFRRLIISFKIYRSEK